MRGAFRKIMEISDILSRHGFRFKKGLGQNFITDTGLLNAVARDAGVTKADTVVEIGAGAGTLTAALSRAAKSVTAFDVDETLKPVLDETLRGADNVRVVFRDVLKTDDEELVRIIGGEEFKLVANIPYYITTPLIMRFAESSLKVKSMTVMVQEEVARRIAAAPGSSEYGAIGAAIALRGDAKIKRTVPRSVFRPVPNVDSAVIRIDFYDKFPGADINAVSKLIRAAFQMRRKTLVNNIGALTAYTKDEAQAALESIGFDARVRGEQLSAADFVALSTALSEMKRA